MGSSGDNALIPHHPLEAGDIDAQMILLNYRMEEWLNAKRKSVNEEENLIMGDVILAYIRNNLRHIGHKIHAVNITATGNDRDAIQRKIMFFSSKEAGIRVLGQLLKF